MFRHRQIGGRTEYTMEDYQGKVLKTIINPEIGFEIWMIRETEKLLGEYGIVGAAQSPVPQITAYEGRVHRNIN